ncbi:MAG TPA: enoyl-CoA hydratase [Acidimicrobiales bacterium]|nr:enoyl-CoA hydratase [Acidimicrobiales bacterium]
MADDVVLVQVDEGVATVVLNRPEARNALNRDLRRAIPRTIVELDERDDVAAIVLTGTDPAFCAGVDLKELAAGGGGAPASDDERVSLVGGGGPGRSGPFPDVATPVIGAINGVAITGGFELALACDFLVASEHARFADTHARVGIMPGWGLTVLLPEAVGVRRAKELSTTGNFLDAETALAWGLVNHVVPHDELLPFARKLAADIAGVDGRAVRRMLATYDEGGLRDGAGAWALEAEVSLAWQGSGFDPASIEANRQAVVARGRTQLQ